MPPRWVVWLALGLGLTIVFIISDWIVLPVVRPIQLLVLGMLCSALWIATAPLIVRVVQLLPEFNSKQWAPLLVHIPISVVYSLVCTSAFAWLMWVSNQWTGDGDRSFIFAFKSATFYFLLANAIFYGLVVVTHLATKQQSAIDDLKIRESKISQQLALSQLEIMRHQMQPHFLFNSLNSVASLVRMNEMDQAVSAITRIGNVLRPTLSQNREAFSTLESELALIEEYIELERLRFEDRLQIQFEIDDSALDATVPRWLLQPLVENAVVHGIQKKEGVGLIVIRAATSNGKLHLSIEDNGQGLNEQLAEGIGLGNTRKRLEEIYGGEAEIVVSGLPNGTKVDVCVPTGEES